MRALAVFGGSELEPTAPAFAFPPIDVGGTAVRGGFVPARMPEFDPLDPAVSGHVLVRVRAFSCNDGERLVVSRMRGVPARRFTVIGSEFAGEVVWAGPDAAGFTPGTRVASNHAYAGGMITAGAPRDGLATMSASRELLMLPAHRLVRLPAAVSDASAAALTLAAQTAYAMVRRLQLARGARVLVTAAASPTGLAVIQRLARDGAEVHAVTARTEHAARLQELGASRVIPLSDAASGARHGLAGAAAVAQEIGGFDAMVDAFFDLNVDLAVSVLRHGGQYITYGMATKGADGTEGLPEHRADVNSAFTVGLFKNLTFHCNFLGAESDLAEALADAAAGRLQAVIHATTAGDAAAEFLSGSFGDADRFGKVVHLYS